MSPSGNYAWVSGTYPFKTFGLPTTIAAISIFAYNSAMADKRLQRRLAAIVVADVVGYSRLMEQDEDETLSVLKERRIRVLQPVVRAHAGRIVKMMGDGVLLEFPSAVEAVSASLELQRGMNSANETLEKRRHIILRIGVNLGDVVIDGTDLYGDGVNVAARLQGLAKPGEIYVSATVRDQVKSKPAFALEDLGLKYLKSMEEPVHVYRVLDDASGKTDHGERQALPLPAKPSIAVLPFSNLSRDAEHDVFTDGLTEDLITDLSRQPDLFVIARHSTFAYKGKQKDVGTIARELGVRNIVEGSARRAGDRVRINVRLIDAVGGEQIWAERFDRKLEDIFGVQDEVITLIVDALVGRLTAVPPRSRPRSMEAYDLCVRGRRLINAFSSFPEAVREARILLSRAVAIDHDYPEATRWLAFVRWQLWVHGIENDGANRPRALELAQKAVALDAGDAAGRWVLGYLLAYEKRWEESDSEFAAAFALEPNNPDALVMKAELLAFAGRSSEAIQLSEKALRLNPQPPGWYYWELGLAYYAAAQFENAVGALRMEATYRSASRRILAASLARLGRMDEAAREAALFMASNPAFRVSRWADDQPARNPAVVQQFAEGYRMAGLRD